MFGLFRRKRPRIPLEEQLRELATCGIALTPRSSLDALTREWTREHLETDPYRLLLCVMGSDVGDPGAAGEFAFPSDDIWHLDTECIEDHGAYALVARRMSVLAKGALPLEGLRDHVDLDERVAWLEFELRGRREHWDLRVKDDWIDESVLKRFCALLEAQGGARRFTYIDLEGQDCLIGCATPMERELLAKVTGLRVDWLR